MSTLDKNLLGMCYYHESLMYNTRTLPEIQADLALIQQVTNNIKLYHSPWLNADGVDPVTALANCILIAIQAKKLGMYVVFCENNDRSPELNFTAANWADYCTKVIADATAVQTMTDIDGTVYSIDEFLVGNEISIHNDGSAQFQDANFPATIQALCSSIEPVFMGMIGVQDGWWKNGLLDENTKSIRKIHFTLYESDNTAASQMKNIHDFFGEHGELGELASEATQGQLGNGTRPGNVSDQEYADMLEERWKMAHDVGLKSWLFTYKDGPLGYGLLQKTPVDNVPTVAFERLVQLVTSI